MGSWMQVGAGWAGSPQEVTVACVPGRPIPTARFLKPARVTTWLALCSSMQRGNGGQGHRGPLPIVEGILAATHSPSRCFPGHLILIQPLDRLSVQLWKEQGLEVRVCCKRKGPTIPTPPEGTPFFSRSVKTLGQTIGRPSGPRGMGRKTLEWGHI